VIRLLSRLLTNRLFFRHFHWQQAVTLEAKKVLVSGKRRSGQCLYKCIDPTMWQILESVKLLPDIPAVLKLCGPRRVNCSSIRYLPQTLIVVRFEVQAVLLLRIRVLCDVTPRVVRSGCIFKGQVARKNDEVLAFGKGVLRSCERSRPMAQPGCAAWLITLRGGGGV